MKPGPKRSSRRAGETCECSQIRVVWPSETRYAPPSCIREKEARRCAGMTSCSVFGSGKPDVGGRSWRENMRGYRSRDVVRADPDRIVRIT